MGGRGPNIRNQPLPGPRADGNVRPIAPHR